MENTIKKEEQFRFCLNLLKECLLVAIFDKKINCTYRQQKDQY